MKLDLFLKIFTPVLSVIGILVGIWQFTSGQRHNEAMEFKRKVWNEQMHAYMETGELVAQIVNTNVQDTTTYDSLKYEFKKRYWGKMVLFQDSLVEKHMIKFSAEIEDYQSGWSNQNEIKIRGYELLKECKNSLQSSWKELGE